MRLNIDFACARGSKDNPLLRVIREFLLALLKHLPIPKIVSKAFLPFLVDFF
jgi:hypothetical protein